MALKFRGSSQIRDASVSLDKIAHVPSKTVLGRKLDSSGEMASLNSSDFRDVAELSPSDDVEFNSMPANTVDATNSLVSLDSLDVNGVDSAGLTTLTQTLSANGAGNTLNDAEISSSMDALGTSTLNSGLVVSTNPLITDTMTVGNFGETGDCATITGNMDLVGDGILTPESVMNVTGDLTVTSNFEFVGAIGLEPELTSSNVNFDGGVIDGAEIGSTVAASGKFSTLIASDLTVGGDLLQISSDKTVNLETDNLKISDPLLLLGKDNPADVLDLGLIFSYGIIPASDYAITNGSFDSDLSGWQTHTAGGALYGVDYNAGSSDVTIRIGNGQGVTTVGTLLFQRVEFTASAGKQYRFKFDLKEDGLFPEGQIQLSYWDLDSTPIASQSGPILNKVYHGANIGTGDVLESDLIDMDSEGLSGGFYIAVRVYHSQNVQGWNNSSIKIDNVKLYEYDTATQQETEYINPITAGYSGIIRDADQEDGINKFKLFDTQADLSDTSNVDFSNGNLGVLDSHIKGNIKFRDAVSIGFDNSGDVSGSALFYGNNDVSINTTINVDAVQYDDIDFLSLDTSLEGSSASDSKLSSEKAIKSYTDAQVASGGSDDDLEVREIKMASEDDNGDVSLVKVKEIIECIDCDSSNSDVSTEVITLSNNYDSEFMSMSKVFMNGQKLRYGAEYDYILQNDNELKIVSDILTFGDQFEVRYFIASDSESSGSFDGGAGSNESNTPTYPDPTDYGTEENDNVSVWESTPQDVLANGDFETADNWTDYSYGDVTQFGEDFTFDTSWDEVNKRQKLCISNGYGPSAMAITAQKIHYPFVDGETYKIKFNVFYDPNAITADAKIVPTVWNESVVTPTYDNDMVENFETVNQLAVGQEVSTSFVANATTVDSIWVGAKLQQRTWYAGHTGDCVSIDNFMLTDANDVPLTRSINMVATSASGNDGNLEEGSANGLNISIQTVGWPAPAHIPFYFETDMNESDFTGTIVGVANDPVKKGTGKRTVVDNGTGAVTWAGANIFLTGNTGTGNVNIYVADDVLCSAKSYELYIPHPDDGENTKLASISGNITLSQEQSNIDWRNANCGTPTYSSVNMTNVTPCPGDSDTIWLNGTNMTSGSGTGTYSINGGAAVTFNITEASTQFVANIMVGDSWTVTIPTSGDDVVFSGTSTPDNDC